MQRSYVFLPTDEVCICLPEMHHHSIRKSMLKHCMFVVYFERMSFEIIWNDFANAHRQKSEPEAQNTVSTFVFKWSLYQKNDFQQIKSKCLSQDCLAIDVPKKITDYEPFRVPYLQHQSCSFQWSACRG